MSDEPSITQDKRREEEYLEVIRRRLSLLSGTDKVVMQMYIHGGISCKQIAELCGLTQTSVARRVRRLAGRLIDQRYVMCLRNRDKLSPRDLRIARDYLVRGWSMARIRREYRLSSYRVHKSIRAIDNIAGAASASVAYTELSGETLQRADSQKTTEREYGHIQCL